MNIDLHDSVALLRVNGGRGNAIGPDFLAGVCRLFDEAERGGARAIVLTGYDRFFSAGLDLPPLVEYDRPTMERFMRTFADAMLRVFTCPLPVVAGINGHAIAGGCVLALQADRRVMVDAPYRIGLNEVQLGIGLPAEVIESARIQLSTASLSRIVLDGPLSTPAEALALGLIDEVVPLAELEPRCLAIAAQMCSGGGLGFRQLKAALRRPALETIRRVQDAEIESWLDAWYLDTTRAKLIGAAARLKK